METPDALIKFAVQDIVALINSGENPQKATEKVAEQLQLNSNFIKRAAEAVNVALHYSHFKKHANDRASDFPIVDAELAAKNLLGGKEKTAGEFQSEQFSSFEVQEAPNFARYLEDGPHKEAFEQIVNLPEDKKNGLSEKGLYEKTANYIRDLRKTAEDKTAQVSGQEYEVTRSFGRILEKLATAPEYRTPFHEIEAQIFSKYGQASVQYLDLLYKTAGLRDESRGVHDVNYKMFSDAPELKMFDTFMKNAQDLAVLKKEAEEADHQYKFEKAHQDETFRIRGCSLNKIADSPTGSVLEKLELQLKKEAEKIEAIPEEDPVLAHIKAAKQVKLAEDRTRIKAAIDFIDSASSSLGDVADKPSTKVTTNSAGDNRDRAFLLQELATTDPILSKQPTKRVVDSYQQMLRISPELSKEKELVRSYLRQATATQAVDPFQAQQLIEADSKLLKQRQMQQGIKPMGDKE